MHETLPSTDYLKLSKDGNDKICANILHIESIFFLEVNMDYLISKPDKNQLCRFFYGLVINGEQILGNPSTKEKSYQLLCNETTLWLLHSRCIRRSIHSITKFVSKTMTSAKHRKRNNAILTRHAFCYFGDVSLFVSFRWS